MSIFRDFQIFDPFWYCGPLRAKVARQGALLWVLAISAEKQLPLVDEIEALAEDSRGQWRGKLHDLADLLKAGISLPDALEQIPGILPPNVLLAARVGAESGTLGPALRLAAAAFTKRQETIPSSSRGVFVYLCALLCCMVLVVSFIMYYIIPKFKKIFEDFDTELPGLTIGVINLSEVFVEYFYLFLPVLLFLAWVATTLHVAALTRTIPTAGPFRLLSALLPRLYVPDILRNLVLVIEGGRPLAGAVSTMAQSHSQRSLRLRLIQVEEDLNQGDDCWQSLIEAGLLRHGEAAVLAAAQRAGNLPWALRETARSIERRLEFRFAVLLELVRPVLLLGVGILVATFVVGMFMPLIKLLNDLS